MSAGPKRKEEQRDAGAIIFFEGWRASASLGSCPAALRQSPTAREGQRERASETMKVEK